MTGAEGFLLGLLLGVAVAATPWLLSDMRDTKRMQRDAEERQRQYDELWAELREQLPSPPPAPPRRRAPRERDL